MGCARAHARAEERYSRAVAKVSRQCADHPRIAVAVSVLVCLVCGAGLTQIEQETRSLELWVPKKSRAYRDYNLVNEKFSPARYNMFTLESTTGGSVLTKAVLDDYWDFHECFTATTGPGGEAYGDLCFRPAEDAPCVRRTILDYWDYNRTWYESVIASDRDVVEWIKGGAPSGRPVERKQLFGVDFEEDADGHVTSSKGTNNMYIMSNKAADADACMAFELTAMRCLGISGAPHRPVQEHTYPAAKIHGRMDRSLDDELGRVVTLDIPLLVITFNVMFVFMVFVISRGYPCTPRSHVTLAGGTVGIVVLSVVGAYGLGALIFPFTTMNQLLPFILVGIGMDDMLVILFQFRALDPELGTLEERIELAVERCALSITFTTSTDMVAFFLGSMSRLPAVSWFCVYSAISILFIFALSMTFGVAVLKLEAEREAMGVRDCFCCLKPASAPAPYMPSQRMVRVGNGLRASVSARDMKPRHCLGLLLQRGFIAAYSRKWCVAAVLVVFLGATGYQGFNAFTKVEEGFDILDLCADVSYLRDYLNKRDDLGLAVNKEFQPVSVYLKDVRYWEPAEQLLIEQTEEIAHATPTVHPEEKLSWLEVMKLWALFVHRGRLDADGRFNCTKEEFAEMLAGWQDTPTGVAFKEDLVLADGVPELSRIRFYHEDVATSPQQIEAMRAMYKSIETSPLGDRVFVYDVMYTVYSQYEIIFRELVINFTCGIATICVLAAFMLGNVRAVLVVALLLAMVDIWLLAGMYMWGVTLSAVSLICLVMAIGLVVDYLAHILHYFLIQDPALPAVEKLGATMAEVGPAVFLGISTTFLGILPMIFASSNIFRTFFKMFFDIIVFSALHAFLFMPALLLVLNPTKARQTQEPQQPEPVVADAEAPSDLLENAWDS